VKKERKNYSPQDKAAILRRHLLEKVPASLLCEQFRLQSKVFYGWLKQLFDNAPAALERRPTSGKRPDANHVHIDIFHEELGRRESREADQKWMISLMQGKFDSEETRLAIGDAISREDVTALLACIRNEPLKYRNRAVAILSYHRNIRVGHVADFLGGGHSSVDDWIRKFTQHGCQSLLPFRRGYSKPSDKIYRDAVFEILHAPPSAHGINRTTWRLEDLHSVMRQRGLPIARNNIRRIIKDAGYRYRKARRVLTSTDPDYDEKLKEITRTLQSLRPKDKFFSIDEYGPFAIKIKGGRSLVPIGHPRTVPQRQTQQGHADHHGGAGAVDQSNHALLLSSKEHHRNGEAAAQTRGHIRRPRVYILFMGCCIMARFESIPRQRPRDQRHPRRRAASEARSAAISRTVLECDRVSIQWYGSCDHSQQRFSFRGSSSGRHRQIFR
jgi:transposase/transposase-like protein